MTFLVRVLGPDHPWLLKLVALAERVRLFLLSEDDPGPDPSPDRALQGSAEVALHLGPVADRQLSAARGTLALDDMVRALGQDHRPCGLQRDHDQGVDLDQGLCQSQDDNWGRGMSYYPT
ncbi:unnamed protein product [Mortierella alpina]